MLELVLILWVFIWVLAVFDMFRRDWRTGPKVLWALGMLIFPVVGVLAYLVVRPPAAADSDVHMGAATHGSEFEEQTQNRQPR